MTIPVTIRASATITPTEINTAPKGVMVDGADGPCRGRERERVIVSYVESQFHKKV